MIIYLKTEKEIEGFKKAGFVAGQILQTLINETKIGITTKELDNLARKEFERLGVKPAFLNYGGYPATICTSVNKTLVHGLPNDTPLERYDLLSIDVGTDIDGFIGDTAATILVNPIDEISTNVYNHPLAVHCEEALNVAIRMAKDGNYLSDVSEAIYACAKRYNYRVPFEYGGHGIDRGQMHAAPFIPNIPEKGYDVKLRSGMILAIEPMFVLSKESGMARTTIGSDGWGVNVSGLSAHCEHTVLVGPTGGIILTERGEIHE